MSIDERYKGGKIYKIVSDLTDDVYVGSTIQSLSERFSDEKSDYNRYLRGTLDHHRDVIKLFEQDPNCRIQLIEDFPCDNKSQLREREGYWMKATPNCINFRIAGRSKKQWYLDNEEKVSRRKKVHYVANKERITQQGKLYRAKNREDIARRRKIYRETNKDKIKAHKSKQVHCDVCDCDVRKDSVRRHEKTIKHQTNLAKQSKPKIIIRRIKS